MVIKGEDRNRIRNVLIDRIEGIVNRLTDEVNRGAWFRIAHAAHSLDIDLEELVKDDNFFTEEGQTSIIELAKLVLTRALKGEEDV